MNTKRRRVIVLILPWRTTMRVALGAVLTYAALHMCVPKSLEDYKYWIKSMISYVVLDDIQPKGD